MFGRFFSRKFSSSNFKKLSYLSGTSNIPLLSETISQMLRNQAAKRPTSAFQTFCQHKIKFTYQEFDQRVDEIAKGLIALGLQAGDRVGIYSPNRPEWALVQYACARADLILVNVNPAFQARDLEYALNQVQIKTLIMAESFKHSNYVDILRNIIPNVGKHGTTIQSERVPHLKHVVVCGHKKKHKGMISFDDLYKIHTIGNAEEMHRREVECNFESATNIQFTSGTTGYPKGATLSHHNILNNANMISQILNYNENSNICVAVPLYHCFGMVVGSLSALASGGNAIKLIIIVQ